MLDGPLRGNAKLSVQILDCRMFVLKPIRGICSCSKEFFSWINRERKRGSEKEEKWRNGGRKGKKRKCLREK